MRKCCLIDCALFAEIVWLRWMMKWARERDLLVAQTMAFVQSVTGKKPEPDPPVESVPVFGFEPNEAPMEMVAPPQQPPLKPAIVRSAVREEIAGRVAAFRAHQHRFDRERDRHFDSVLTGIRAAITDRSKAPPL
jgi:hypothetical protein